jgi:hypothetical protein
MKSYNRRIILLLFFLFIISYYCLGDNNQEDQKTGLCKGGEMKIGDKALLRAVMMATGPALMVETDGMDKGAIFYGTQNTDQAPAVRENWTDIFSSGTIGYDSGFIINTDSDVVSCANYASICPGSYTYDRNGIRIDYPGGGDQNYRIHCCGNYDWTPTYKPPDTDGINGDRR